MGYLDTLRNELLTDPLTRNYAGMSDQAAADDLNTAYRTQLLTPTGAAILDEIRPGSWPTAQGDRDFLMALASLGTEPVSDAGQVKAKLTGGGPNEIGWGATGETATKNGINALFSETVTRARELGLTPKVQAVDVAEARA